MRKIILAIFVCFFFCGTAWSATYYVDYTAGADTNNGTATGTPFQHCPGDPAATDTASSTTFAAGDKIIFKGGVTYTLGAGAGISVSWGGDADTTAGRIIYDGDSGTHAARWGSGTTKAKIDGDATATAIFTAVSNKSYVTINNFELTNIGSNTVGGLIDTNGKTGNTYWKITNNTIHGVNDETDPDNYRCIVVTGTNWDISSNTISDCGKVGIWLASGANSNTISLNTLNDIMCWGIGAGYTSGNTISRNYFYNLGNSMFDAAPGSCHSNGIMTFVQGTTDQISNLSIIRNYFKHDAIETVVDAGYTGEITLQLNTTGASLDGLLIDSNVFENFRARAISISNNDCTASNITIVGNTAYSTATATSAGSSFLYVDDTATVHPDNVIVKNNIARVSYLYLRLGDGTGAWTNLDIDYNTYAATAWANPFAYNNGVNRYTWAQWFALETFDQHSYYDLPSFVSAPTDLSLQSGDTVAKDKGTALGEPYTTDILGTSRPQGAAWDIGAFEYYETGSIHGVTASGVTIR